MPGDVEGTYVDRTGEHRIHLTRMQSTWVAWVQHGRPVPCSWEGHRLMCEVTNDYGSAVDVDEVLVDPTAEPPSLVWTRLRVGDDWEAQERVQAYALPAFLPAARSVE